MALYKRGNTWWMNFWFDGYHIQRSTRCKSKRDAETVERAYQTQLAKGEVGIEPKKDGPNFKDAVTEFLEWSASRQAPNTTKRYVVATKALIKFFGDLKVDRISVSDVENFITKRSKEHCAPRGVKPKGAPPPRKIQKKIISKATVNKELACLKKMFSRLVAANTVSSNPVKQVEFFDENSESGRVLNYEEERLYLMAASQPLQDYAAILVETGLRPDELCRLTVQDVSIPDKTLFVRKGKTKAATRSVPLTERASLILAARIEKAKGRFLFAGGKGGKDIDSPAVKFNNAHYGALKRSKIDLGNRSGTNGTCTVYSFRHTFATRFLESNGDLLTLAAILGHSSLRMVMRYAHPSDMHKWEAIKRMEANRPNTTTLTLAATG
ncbi:MAG: tyrosine-type recombinase/integrase [Pyrinomonadaceae bacterium]